MEPKKGRWRRAVLRFLRLLEYEYCGLNDCPLADRPAPRDVKGYRSDLFVSIVEAYSLWSNFGVPPSVDNLGYAGQNPLLIAAFRRISEAEARKRIRDDLRDSTIRAAEDAATRAG